MRKGLCHHPAMAGNNFYLVGRQIGGGCHKKFSSGRRIIVDTIFLPEKISGSFRAILTTLFKHSNEHRQFGGNSPRPSFLT
jgi:hypothetical protein